MRVNFFLANLVLISVISFTHHSFAATLVFGTPRSEKDYLGKWTMTVLRQALLQLGHKVEFRQLPSAGAQPLDIKSAALDGEVVRHLGFSNEHPEMVAIYPALGTARFVAYSKNEKLKIQSWSDLKEKKWRIEYPRGSSYGYKMLLRYAPKAELSESFDFTQSLIKLANGRIDLFVADEDGILAALVQESDLKKESVFFAGLLGKVSLHIHINKQHEELRRGLSKVLQEMSDRGEVKIIHDKIAKEFSIPP